MTAEGYSPNEIIDTVLWTKNKKRVITYVNDREYAVVLIRPQGTRYEVHLVDDSGESLKTTLPSGYPVLIFFEDAKQDQGGA